MVRVLEAQVECLRAEVAALQDRLQDKQKDITFHLRGQMKDAMCVSLTSAFILDIRHILFGFQYLTFSHLHLISDDSVLNFITVNVVRVPQAVFMREEAGRGERVDV